MTLAMARAMALGAGDYRPEPAVYARTEAAIIQRELWQEAA